MEINIAIFSTTGAYSGIEFATPDIAEALGPSLSQGRGSLVMDEDEGSPAGNANAELHGGDKVVININ